MVNPRTILVHIRNEPHPVRKERHTPLTEQFSDWAGGSNIKKWLKDNTVLQITEPPILPMLVDRFTASGRIAGYYLRSVEDRHRKIASAVTTVTACLDPQEPDFQVHLARMSPDDRHCVETNLCRFDLALFSEIGQEIERTETFPERSSPWLTPEHEASGAFSIPQRL